MPVREYTGGDEHATMHLLYTRFWTKVMRDVGLISFGEPMTRLFCQGDVVAWTYIDPEGKYIKPISALQRGEKYYLQGKDVVLSKQQERMSKSKNNGVAPDEDRSAISGAYRWLLRVWNLVIEADKGRKTGDGKLSVVGRPSFVDAERELRRKTHQTIKRVTQDIENFKFNTMIAALMEFANYLQKARETDAVESSAWREAIEAFVLMLAPNAPHIAEEMWQRIGKPYSVHQQPWPKWDAKIAAEEMFTLVVQVNG
ncbi:MAG: class I tRNA ligase family protein, partial [Chloroflexi bacterium]|nr:class I tRNA ligase family protein [Chloroflexota bacterium]